MFAGCGGLELAWCKPRPQHTCDSGLVRVIPSWGGDQAGIDFFFSGPAALGVLLRLISKIVIYLSGIYVLYATCVT